MKAALFLLGIFLPALAPAETRYKVVKAGEAFWFEDQAGKRFFSLGVDCAGGCYGHWEKSPMEPKRREWISRSLVEWGFNTAACWSSPSLWQGRYVMDQLYPSFQPEELDVFDTETWGYTAHENIKAELAGFLGKPEVVGYFLMNEVKWRTRKILINYRSMRPEAPGSRALLSFTRSFYGGDIRLLNRAWSTTFTGFGEVCRSMIGNEGVPDEFLDAWRNVVAGRYYAEYAALVRSVDPGCLILGERNAGPPDLEYIKAVAPAFDVISVNDYNRYGALNGRYREYCGATGKPVMITEWSFSGFTQPGLKSLQNIDVYTQENRAIGYRKFVMNAARAPWMVGMHWFLWNDYGPWRNWKAIKSRRGREYVPDNNMGLVSHDEKETYATLVRECARTNAEVAAVHAAAVSGTRARDEGPAPEETVPRLAVDPVVDGRLGEWRAVKAVRPALRDSLREKPAFNHSYRLAWTPAGLFLAVDATDTHLDWPGEGWAWEGDYLEVSLAPGGPGGTGPRDGLYMMIAPRGGTGEPFAWGWGEQDLSGIRAKRRDRKAGFTLEAFIPASYLGKKGLEAGAKLEGWLSYHNQSDLYDTFRPARLVLAP
jgi:hypothetical protein